MNCQVLSASIACRYGPYPVLTFCIVPTVHCSGDCTGVFGSLLQPSHHTHSLGSLAPREPRCRTLCDGMQIKCCSWLVMTGWPCSQLWWLVVGLLDRSSLVAAACALAVATLMCACTSLALTWPPPPWMVMLGNHTIGMVVCLLVKRMTLVVEAQSSPCRAVCGCVW